ncbi:MAG: hypothetical protein JWM85_1873 [Acidimicrobiaceae bacterium]|nr:hypothetical protein [Acidimicrobiaceae bacterium]
MLSATESSDAFRSSSMANVTQGPRWWSRSTPVSTFASALRGRCAAKEEIRRLRFEEDPHCFDLVDPIGLVRMARNRFLWQSVDDALHERAGDAPSTWLKHYRDIYSEAQIIGMHRMIQGDNQKDHLTLCRVLGTLQRRLDAIDARHLESLADVISPAVRAQMEAEWLTKGGHLDRAIPARDRKSDLCPP